MQVKSSNKFGTSLHSRGHLWEYYHTAERMGLSKLEVAVVIGAHPGVIVGASAKDGIKADAYDMMGGILQRPLEITKCQSIDLDVPANAEIVLEGEIPVGVFEEEGPFSEYTGYVTGPERSTQHVLKVNVITRRKDAIFQSIIPGKSKEHLLLSDMSKEASLLQEIQRHIPRVSDVFFPFSGSHFHVFVSVRDKATGLPNQVALLLMGLNPYAKLVVVVDADIDVTDEDAVWEAVATQMQADKNVNIIRNVFHHKLDPSASRDGVSDKLIMDATKPIDWKFMKTSIPPEILEAIRRKL